MVLFRKIYDKLQFKVSDAVNSCYEKYVQSRLKNKDFTILCSNCIGGVIYHRLGLQFRSPTVNLWMHQREFIQFAANLREYIDEDLIFVESEYDYPVAQLKDVKIYFNHSRSEEEARNDWNRRKARVNYDNLFLIMYDRENLTEDDFRRFAAIPCKGRVILSDRDQPDFDYIKTIRPSGRPMGQQFMDRDWFGLRTFEKQFDYVGWLNQE